jgi:hypothetical protein
MERLASDLKARSLKRKTEAEERQREMTRERHLDKDGKKDWDKAPAIFGGVVVTM